MLTVFRHDTYSAKCPDNQTYEERVAFHIEIGEARTYQKAWNIILNADSQTISHVSIVDREYWDIYGFSRQFPNFVWPDGVNYVYYNDQIRVVVVPPSEYNQNSVLELIRVLDLPYRIEGTEELDG